MRTIKPPEPDPMTPPSEFHPAMLPFWQEAARERLSLFEHFDRHWVGERAIRLAERRRAAVERAADELF
jgi:hypothetical protein